MPPRDPRPPGRRRSTTHRGPKRPRGDAFPTVRVDLTPDGKDSPVSKLLYSATMSLDGFTARSRRRGQAGRQRGYVNVFGASVAKQCLEAGLLDEVLVLIAPALLGDGTRLFDNPGGTVVRLEPLRPDERGALRHRYRVVQ
jgi:hypothetical protein